MLTLFLKLLARSLITCVVLGGLLVVPLSSAPPARRPHLEDYVSPQRTYETTYVLRRAGVHVRNLTAWFDGLVVRAYENSVRNWR